MTLMMGVYDIPVGSVSYLRFTMSVLVRLMAHIKHCTRELHAV